MVLVWLGNLTIFFVALFGATKWRKLSGYHQILVVQCFAAIITELTGAFWTYRMHQRNHWIYNSYFFLEVVLVILMVIAINGKSQTTIILAAILASYGVPWIASVSINGINSFSVSTVIWAGIVITGTFSYLLYQAYNQNRPERSILMLSFSSFILYYSCCIPIFAFFNYLNQHYPVAAGRLYDIIPALVIVRYAIIGYSFFLEAKRNVQSSTS